MKKFELQEVKSRGLYIGKEYNPEDKSDLWLESVNIKHHPCSP